MQYHTKASFDLKNGKLHELYEQFRILKENDLSASILKDEMIHLSSMLQTPNNIGEIKSYEK